MTAAETGRLDKILSAMLDISRQRSRDLIEQNCVQVNGQAVKPKTEVKPGDVITCTLPEDENADVLPEDIDLDIVYEDQDVIVVNKPKGMVVHPAPGHHSGTLVNALLYHCKDLSGINGVLRPGIVHRIDKDTSGLIVAAKNDMAHNALAEQLKDKTCRREYQALVHNPFSHTHGTIQAPIGRDEKDRQKMAVTAKNSKEAVTHFEVIKNYARYAHILCRLDTGRTHQIRVHMQYIQHPIVGDPRYGQRKTLKTNGQLLHASALEFNHPRTGERMRFEAPLEAEFASILEQLDKGDIQ
jgi:23S rRNA pseudouridine1911/1915/1917 synthase